MAETKALLVVSQTLGKATSVALIRAPCVSVAAAMTARTFAANTAHSNHPRHSGGSIH